MMTKKGTTHYISGNTYPVRDKIKSLGCRWDAGKKAWYTDDSAVAAQAEALVNGQPALNSPPPVDLTGDASPAELAARYERTAVVGAKIAEFSCYGLDKGEQPKRNGTIRTVRGKRYVQVAHSPRRYLSRDMLEDFDMFDARPGGSYQWSGVEVEPTASELAEAAAKAAEKEARERPLRRRREIEALVRRAENNIHTCDFTGLARLWGNSRMAGSEGMYGDQLRLVYTESSYDDGPCYWQVVDTELAAEAAALKVS